MPFHLHRRLALDWRYARSQALHRDSAFALRWLLRTLQYPIQGHAIVIFAALLQAASSLPTDPSILERSISALEKDVSILDSAINALAISSACWEFWVWAFSGLVVIGVVMEWWVIEYDWDDEVDEWAIWDFVGIRRPPSRPSIVKWRVEMASVFLIAIGVAGELGVGVEISHINGLVRSKDAELRTKNAELRRESDQLVSLVNERAAKLEQEAESERLARARLEAKLRPRRLSSKQIDDLGAKLKVLAAGSHPPIAISSEAFDSESRDFAKDFETAFKAGEWTPTVVPWDQLHDHGLDIGMLEDPASPGKIPAPFVSVVQSIQDTITAIGVPCRIRPLSPTDQVTLQPPVKNVLYLLVHRKPDSAPSDTDGNKRNSTNAH